jgi:hypothetical protein
MKSIVTLLLSLCVIGLAAPAPASSVGSLELKDIFDRAVGDKCKAPEGSGDCRKTSNCKGISYPTNLCPKDPNDVQVRIPLAIVDFNCNACVGDSQMLITTSRHSVVWRSNAKLHMVTAIAAALRTMGAAAVISKLGFAQGVPTSSVASRTHHHHPVPNPRQRRHQIPTRGQIVRRL